MKIRPRNIPKFQEGSKFNLGNWIQQNPEYYKWYSSIYPNAQVLQGSPLKQRNDLWNKNQLSSSHYTTDDLQRSAYNNYLYTNDYDARSEDLTRWGESQKDFGTISDRDFVNRYNTQARSIREAREAPQTYNTKGYTDTNRTFRNMFYNRSRQGTNTPLYTIGYQDNIEDIEGTSTWQRRMDRYEKPFNEDTPEGQKNRTFFITRPDGTKIKIYKKQNGDIGLFNDPNDPESPKDPEFPNNPQNTNEPQSPNKQTQVPAGHQNTYGFDWEKINEGLQKVLGNPDLYAFGRLAGNLINNERVYNEQLKGIKPVLRQTYNTHRQVVGDEATKQAYYRRAAQGQTAAARPFTSDADRQMAYQMEARRVGDELRAQGDLADNQEIRRTSDESNQHQWANTQRATEVANANLASINQANALRHNLLAQKHSAQWSSIDNALQGIEYRKRQQLERDRAIKDQIWMLQEQNNLENNSQYLSLQQKAEDAWEKAQKAGKNPSNDLEVKKALQDLRNWKTQYQIRMLQSRPSYAKSGTKITYKKKEDLLYKSARDVVEHFRKMSKMSSDALNRKQPKIEKLTSHPKGNTRKYQQGGLAPFTIYKPIALGGETTVSSQGSTSGISNSGNGNGKSKGSDTLDMIKELFKQVAGKGLPSDVNSLYVSMQNVLNKAKAFGNELSTDDIASMYLSQMKQLNDIQYLKANYDKAEQAAISNDAVNEIAVDTFGRIACQNKETGDIEYTKSIKEAQDKNITPLTNGQLLQLRAQLPNFAGRTDLDQVIANGIGMTKIADFLKSQLPRLGSSTQETSIEGYTKKDTQDIKQGMELLKNAPEGDYKYTLSRMSKDQQEQAKKAIQYLDKILPRNMKAVLDARAEMGGISSLELIGSLVASGMDSQYKESLNFDAVTGKAAKDSNEKSSENSSDGLKLDAATALISGKGYRSEIELNPGSSYSIKAQGRFSEFQKHSGENMGAGTTMQEATTSTLHGVLDWNKATLGGSRIISTAYNKVILNNGEIVEVDLPVDPSDSSVPDFDRLKQLENLDKQLRLNNIEDSEQNWKKVNELCDKIGIPHKYTSSGKLNTTSWKRFAAFQVTAPDTTLVNKNVILDTLGIADDSERQLYNSIIQQQNPNNKNFELADKTLGIFGTREELYKGTVFVPIKESYVGAALSGSQTIKMTEATNLELREQGYNPTKASTYKKPEYTL